MPAYKYKSIDKTGKENIGTYDAADKDEVIDMIRSRNEVPVTIEEQTFNKSFGEFTFTKSVKTKDISIFCRQFHAMTHAGVSVITCLEILKLQSENKRIRTALHDICEEVQTGIMFSECLYQHTDVFPELLIHMIEAGEISGNLDEIMLRMSVHYEKETKVKGKIQNAMIYPSVLAVIAVTVVFFLIIFVMPTFVDMFQKSGTALPKPTQILLSISDTIRGYWYIIVGIIVAAILILPRYLKTEQSKLFFDKILLRIPVIKETTVKVITSRFTRTLSTLLISGIPLIQALEIVSQVVGNKIAEKGILLTKEEIGKGVSLASSIKEIGLFPPMVDSMVQIGEESGTLDDMLEKTASFYDEEVEVALQTMTALIEPIMVVFMAVVIGAIVIAMLLPMLDMVNTVGV